MSALGAAKAMGAVEAAGDVGCFKDRFEIDEECAEECVDTDGVREKAWRLRDAADRSESREMRDMDRDLATASTEFFLVCVGERWGIIGARAGSGSTGAAGLVEFLK